MPKKKKSDPPLYAVTDHLFPHDHSPKFNVYMWGPTEFPSGRNVCPENIQTLMLYHVVPFTEKFVYIR